MAFPRRTFTADEGQPSTGAAGPDAIEYDLDNAFAMFNPMATLRTGEPGGIDAEENIRDVRLIPDQKPQSDTGKIPALLSGLANRIKAIMGTPDWKNDPPTTLAALASQSNQINVDQNAAPTGDIGNIQQVVSWLANRIKAITGRNDWKDDPAVNLQTLADAATHEDISFHSQSKSTHGVGPGFYIAKTSRSDQYPSWNDIKDRPSLFPPERHQHDASDVVAGVFDVNRIPNLPASKITTGQFDPNLIPGLPASKVTSGTFSVDRLPKASLTQQGIVQLTKSRSSTREDLALTAKAMNDHRTSADHDERYPTRAEVDQLLSQRVGFQWMQPGDTILAESLGQKLLTLSDAYSSGSASKIFVVPNPGRYRITGEAYRNSNVNNARV